MEDLAGLFNWLGKPGGFSAVGEYFSTEEPTDRSLLQILEVEQDSLKPLTAEMLESLKDTTFIRSLKSGFRAFSQFQDIFPLTVRAKDIGQLDHAHLINRDYCYYESLVYLRSSIIAALDKNPVAAMTLLRPFLELSVLQLYWYLRCESEGHSPYYKWLEGRHAEPGFTRQIEQIVKKLSAQNVIPKERMKDLKETLRKMFTNLCSYNHGPKMRDSMTCLSGAQTGMSLDSFYLYLATVDLLMSQIVYLYILTYPMILFPVERTKKWGVSGPIGTYVEANAYSLLKAYVGEKSVQTLRTSLSNLPEVKNLLNSFGDQPDLSDAEQEEKWNDFVQQVGVKENPSEWPARLALNRSYYRALRWSLNYVNPRPADDEVDHDQVEKMFEYAKSW